LASTGSRRSWSLPSGTTRRWSSRISARCRGANPLKPGGQRRSVIAEIKREQEESSFIEEEIARIRASIRRLADQERRLIRLFGLGQVTEEYVLREAGQVKKVRQALESELAELQQQRQRIVGLDGLSDQVRAFCAQVAERLDDFDFEEKRLALRALQIKVVVGREGARLTGAIPQDLATIGRTWACPSSMHLPAEHRPLVFRREVQDAGQP